MLAVCTLCQGLKKGCIDSDRHHSARPLAEGLSTSRGQLLQWVARLSFVCPRLNLLVSHRIAVDGFRLHARIVIRNTSMSLGTQDP